ncbi:hypothetical protein GGX14DRAFT_538287 [Mycena pura]|uniref:Uncharacterized protein n=1 Tax=Mycena pura TaxID=153505 RepID=A0AAD6YVB5_9AGAR|nr:hypothetical protein GGX14DRAFT_538287 [Mycena pura]
MDSKTAFQTQDLPAPASHVPKPAPRKRCSKGRRLLRVVGLSALMVWIGARYFSETSRFSHWQQTTISDLEWPFPPDVEVVKCAQWSDNDGSDAFYDKDYPYSADASFKLPVSSDTLFLLSRSVARNHGGVISAGEVEYIQSDDVSDNVKVDITARYRDQEYLDATKVCLLTRDGDQNGVGIFTKWEGKGRQRGHTLQFKVTVTFPSTDDGSPLSISNLQTDLEIFAQKFGDMSGVEFKAMSLKSVLAPILADYLSVEDAKFTTTLAPVNIQALVAERADVVTSLGSIEGTYNASKSLTLTTSNAPIKVNVNLFNDDDDDVVRLQLLDSNGPIEGNISLFSTLDASAFDVSARTANARLALDVLAAPVDANIAVRAATSLGAASVKLPTTYEGSISATTSLGSVKVKFDTETADPSGAGRTRIGRVEQVRRNMVRGRVGWSEAGLSRGVVDVTTSLASVDLEV